MVAVLVCAGLIAGTVGWAGFHLLGGPERIGTEHTLIWAACLGIALACARVASAAVTRRHGDVALEWGVVLALGWAAANATGWHLAVEVGGPLVGVACGVVLAGAASGAKPVEAVLVGLGGLVGVLASHLVLAGVSPLVGLVAALVVGLLAALAARTFLAPKLPMTPIVVMAVSCGTAWVGAWELASNLLTPISVSVSIAGELVLAVVAGAFAFGLLVRGHVTEPLWRTVIRWGLAASVGVLAAEGVAAVLAALLPGAGGPIDLLDVGTTVTMPLAAWFAAAPTLRGLLRNERADRSRHRV